MKSLIVIVGLLLSLNLFAVAKKTYQVTGPVLELTDTSIVVQKGKEKWEIARDATTDIKGNLKVGEKVTIEYVMMAKSVGEKADKKMK